MNELLPLLSISVSISYLCLFPWRLFRNRSDPAKIIIITATTVINFLYGRNFRGADERLFADRIHFLSPNNSVKTMKACTLTTCTINYNYLTFRFTLVDGYQFADNGLGWLEKFQSLAA